MAEGRFISHAIVAALLVLAAATACSSSRPGPPPAAAEDGETFATAIQPLIQEKCQTCHREGGIAPFSLVTYEDVAAVGEIAKDKVARREMPPWGARDAPGCDVRHGFEGDLSLTDEQIERFVSWVDRGMPRGAPASHASAEASFGPAGLTEKTHALESAGSYVVEAGGEDAIMCFPIDPGFEKDTWIGESIVVPADPRVVHHSLVYIDRSREGAEKAGSAGSYPCFGGSELTNPTLLLAWSPGGTSTRYGENAGLMVPQGAHLVVQVHYHPIATSATGRMSLELAALPEKPARAATFVLVGNAESASDPGIRLLPGPSDPPSGPAFLIPSDAKDHVEAMELVMPIRKTRLSAIGAHMHWAGVGMKVEVTRKAPEEGEAAKECLLGTTYDFDWQRTYTYDAPIEQLPILRAGDKVRITCTYDNTMDNRHIARETHALRMARPPAIRLGGESRDEMCQAILVFVD